MTDITIFGEKRMTVKEVSVVLGTAESTIRNKVALLFPEVPQNGKPTLLDEYQITAIKKSLVPHDLTLKSKLENTSTDLEMARKAQEVMAWMAGKVSTLEAQLAEAQPKVAFFDAVCESKDTIEMGDVAKILNIPGYGRNNLFAFLREKKILMYDNAPYQTFTGSWKLPGMK